MNRWTEADVVVELCHQLKLLKFQVRCEVRVASLFHRSGQMRCDVAIVRGDEILCIFEVKDREPASFNPMARQRRAYRETSETVPVFYVYGMEGVEFAVRRGADWCNPNRRLASA